MTTTGGFDPSRAAGAMLVEHCDVPLGMTLCEWRRRGGPLADEASGVEGGAASAAPAVRARRSGLGRHVRRAFGRS